ncbi:alpha/beta-hydrolase [Piedraia hortae CBS 480.64]|uniref:Carboxypeptidase n=1 Tax=Piedraia hortae CBS 480.64 TaxID=1314780 RepID=A0A6A7C232_9PEZI|nr:alpha/beta-hydrolase [Piedraia hortae CBS 480.64]
MHLFLVAALCSLVCGRSLRHVGRGDFSQELKRSLNFNGCYGQHCHHNKTNPIPHNNKTAQFYVDGSAIPNVTFDIGPSYAGLLPISSEPNSSELFFWFFPSSNPFASDEILIWLNGGPGCSSLEGLLQEIGPFLWQYGTFRPVQNPWAWTDLTNVVFVEQPAGTGFSQKRGTPTATSEEETSAQFLGFWKNFIDTFSLHNRKIFIAGESYAGYYVPYIADAMHNETDPTYFNVDSILFYDPVVSTEIVQTDIPAVAFVEFWEHLFAFNETFMTHLRTQSRECGYDEYLATALTYPPKGPLPPPPSANNPACRLWDEISNAAVLVNPCWDVYQVATTCPLLWDVLGFPGSIPYLPGGTDVYFNRSDVQKAINAPQMEWAECSSGVLDTDTSLPSSFKVLPRIIPKNNRTIIGHGLLDFILLANGTRMAIQNMTFGGKQGFETPPEKWEEFFVPYHEQGALSTIAGAGVMGAWVEERGLTYVEVTLSGHMVPQYAPSAAWRQVEYLLGRIDGLGEGGK